MMTRLDNKRHRLFIWFVSSIMIVSFLPFFLAPKVVPSKPDRSNFVRQKLNKTGVLSSVDSPPTSSREERRAVTVHKKSEGRKEGCAICFFGLPRSFRLLVLPSIIRNVLIPNKQNKCDIYLHYYHVKEETGGRSGYGGSIDPEDSLLLKDAVKQVYADQPASEIPHVSITMDTDADFWKKRGKLLEKYRTTVGPDGEYLYFPWMAKNYEYPTSIDNIVKQWHSIQAAWDDMEQNSIILHKNYTRVAMMRNDAIYVTPFDIHQIGAMEDAIRDVKNQYAAVPNWARFPINDRMLYGPYKAVKIWATERFDRLESHVVTYEEPGYGMHSERFLNHSIFPAIRQLGIEVVADPDICFFRARADGSTWINDCTTRNGAARGFRTINTQQLVEDIVGRSCRKSKFNAKIIQLHCNDQSATNQTTT